MPRVRRNGSAETQLFAETLAAAVADIEHYRRRRTLVLCFGLEGEPPLSLRGVAEILRVSHERIRQIRERAVDELGARAAGDDPSDPCARLVQRADALAEHFDGDDPALLDALEADSGLSCERALFILIRRLAGDPRRKASARYRAAARLRQEQLFERRAEQRRRGTEERRSAALQRVFDHALWPTTTRGDWTLARFSARRQVQLDRERAGSFHSSKLGRAVQYESGLELAFLERLEQDPSVVAYQEQPVAVDYRLAGRRCVYVPDVAVLLDDGRALVIEIKPRMQMALLPNLCKWAALARWCGRHGAGVLITDGRASVTDMVLGRSDHDFCVELLDAVRLAPLRYHAYRTGFGRDRTTADLAAAVGSTLVAWRTAPFSLSMPTDEEASQMRALMRLLRKHQPSSVDVAVRPAFATARGGG